MKNTLTHKMITVLGILVFFIACEKNDTDDNITTADKAEIEAAVKSGEWHITYYFDSDKDETNDYVGYVFTFNANGALGATNGDISVSGAWSVTDSDNSSDDSSDDDIDFNIFFTSPELFEELTDDWEIQKFTSTKIELYDVSGGDGTTDYLTFEKS